MFDERQFVPKWGLSNGHVMTLAAWARPRRFPALPSPETRLLSVLPDTQVRADCFWQTAAHQDAPLLLGLHGLEGSSEAHYMRGIAEKAYATGWNVVLLNQRNCGGTEHLTPRLYHSGLTADPINVLRQVMAEATVGAIAVIGYSLGGNLALKLASELADLPDLPVRAVVAISPTIDLALCVDAIEWRENALYQWNFVKDLKARMRRKAAAFPDRFDLSPLRHIRTIRQFDDAYTAPLNGFGTAANYYAINSARPLLARIPIPALILAAEDDPFVPPSQFRGPDLTNPLVEISLQTHGGHCGFIGRSGVDYWAERVAVTFVSRTVG